MPSKAELAADARALVRRALEGLAGHDRRRQRLSLCLADHVATDASGAPIFLISRLAQHTKNLATTPAPRSCSTAPARRRSAARRAGDALRQGREDGRGGGRGGGFSRGIRRPRSMPTSPISPSGGSTSRAPTISAASAASSISRRPSFSCRHGRRRRAARGRAGHHRAYERGPRRRRPPLCHAACRRRPRASGA